MIISVVATVPVGRIAGAPTPLAAAMFPIFHHAVVLKDAVWKECLVDPAQTYPRHRHPQPFPVFVPR